MHDELYATIPVGAPDRPVAYHRTFRKITNSTVAAVLLSQAWYWSRTLPAERDGWFYKTRDEWEEETGLTRSEQETARKHLKENGILSEESRGGIDRTLWYRIDVVKVASLIRESFAADAKAGIPPMEGTGPRQSKSDNPTVVHTEITAETTTETTLSPRDMNRLAHENNFAEFFWAHYPRKEGKSDALKAWMKLEPDKSLTFTIRHALLEQVHNNWKYREKQYIPLPASWLRGKRWEDEIVPYTNGNGKPKPQYYEKDGSYTIEGALAKARGEI